MTTTPDIEWHFVVAPEAPPTAGGWPTESLLLDVHGRGGPHMRSPMPTATLEARRVAFNERLKSLNEPELTWVEVVGGRMCICRAPRTRSVCGPSGRLA